LYDILSLAFFLPFVGHLTSFWIHVPQTIDKPFFHFLEKKQGQKRLFL